MNAYYKPEPHLMAGLWTAHREHGMPIDISLIECRQRGVYPDWCEAIASATLHDELGSLDIASGGIPLEAKERWMNLVLANEGDPKLTAEKVMKLKKQ
jgi:hypothetical protein